MNELDRQLERVSKEPAYGPEFYQALLTEPVYVLLPAGAVFTPSGTVRFIMWTGEDGQRVIPCFSNRAGVRRALTKQTQALRLQGRTFLEACRGGIVVLNPNERYFCRLEASHVVSLLDTGSPNAPDLYAAPHDMELELRMPDVPAPLLHSLTLLFAQLPGVESAYIVTMRGQDESKPPVWLIAIVVDSDRAAEQAANHVTSLLVDCSPQHNVDLLRLVPGDANHAAMAAHVKPFYERSVGERVTLDATTMEQ